MNHPLRSVRRAAVALALFVTSCAGAAGAGSTGELRFELADKKVLVRDSGAIIYGGHEVASITEGGKVVDSAGKLLAFVNEDNIRLRGGATLPVVKSPAGELYIPEQAQTDAGLSPIRSHLNKEDRLASSKGAKGIPVEGLRTSLSRRVVLLILVLAENGMI